MDIKLARWLVWGLLFLGVGYLIYIHRCSEASYSAI